MHEGLDTDSPVCNTESYDNVGGEYGGRLETWGGVMVWDPAVLESTVVNTVTNTVEGKC